MIKYFSFIIAIISMVCLHSQIVITDEFGHKQLKKISFSIEKPKVIQGFSFEPHDYLEFRPNGNLSYFRLKNSATILNVLWPENTEFTMAKENYLESCRFYSTVKVQGINCKKEIEWYQSGKLKNFTLAKPEKINGYSCNDYVELFENGTTRFCKLLEETTIDGYPCAADIISFFYNGKLCRFFLAKDKKMQNILFHKGSQIYLYENGNIRVCTVSKTTEIDGSLVGTYNMPEIYFYPNGQVERFHLLKPNIIQGYSLSACHVTFYPSGKLKSAELKKTSKIQGMDCEASSISFYKNGDMESCTLAKPILRNGILGVGKSSFYENGSFRYTEVTKNIKIGNIPLYPGDHIQISNTGKITSCWLSYERTVKGIKLSKNTIEFHENEQIKSIAIPNTLRIQGYLCASHNKIYFHENGKLERCTTAENVTIHDLNFPIHAEIYFYASGAPFKVISQRYNSSLYQPLRSRKYIPIPHQKITIPHDKNVANFIQEMFTTKMEPMESNSSKIVVFSEDGQIIK